MKVNAYKILVNTKSEMIKGGRQFAQMKVADLLINTIGLTSEILLVLK